MCKILTIKKIIWYDIIIDNDYMHVLYSDCAIWKEDSVNTRSTTSTMLWILTKYKTNELFLVLLQRRPWKTFILPIIIVRVTQKGDNSLLLSPRPLKVKQDLNTDSALPCKAIKDNCICSPLHTVCIMYILCFKLIPV